MEEIINSSAFWVAIISLIGTILVAAWNVRSAMVGAADEISTGAKTLLAEYRMELTKAQTDITDLEKEIKEYKDELDEMRSTMTEMEVLHEKELKKLQEEIEKISTDYAVLEQKHNDLVKAYNQKDCENNHLLARIEKLEKGDTGPLHEKEK